MIDFNLYKKQENEFNHKNLGENNKFATLYQLELSKNEISLS